MISHPAFTVEPWRVVEASLDLDVLAQTESVFALANGHIGLRANLDEGDPHVTPGTYLNGVHEVHPLPYAEAGYGWPESGETVVNVTDGKIIRLMVDDEAFDVRYGCLHTHQRVLDLRDGVLRRSVEWESPAGRRVRITSTRLVSFVQRAVAAVLYEVEPVDSAARVVLQSELVANEPGPDGRGDPRAAAALEAPLELEAAGSHKAIGLLVHRVRQSGIRVAAAMDHIIDGPQGTDTDVELYSDTARMTVAADLAAGEKLRVVKLFAYAWSSHRSVPAVRAQVGAALAEARHTGWPGLCSAQREFLDAFWHRADVEIDGDPELQQAVRFALFHVLQAGARAEGRALPAKGLTGPGYDGHAFWDTEAFVLPVLSYTRPLAVADALRWRHATLALARERAAQLGLAGATFPWRTIAGRECSGYWPAGTAAFHVNAAIAVAADRYVALTGDREFEREIGLELLVETARLWHSLGYHGGGTFRIDGVTGPDEYSALADNNVYTNLMARRNLRAAAAAAERHPDRARALEVGAEEVGRWREAAQKMFIPYDAERGLHPQADGFLDHEPWEFEATAEDGYPLLLHYPYFELYRRQVIKQADLVLALHVCGDAFSAEEKARDFDYYEALTVRDSSLSACTQAVVAAEVGHLDLAYDLFAEAALMDLEDLEHNSRDGLHIASLAGAWIAAVCGFGGLRDHDGRLAFAPRLPSALTRLAFRLGAHGALLRVEVSRAEASYSLLEGAELELTHHGQPLRLLSGAPQTASIPPAPERQRPEEPAGRAPRRRS